MKWTEGQSVVVVRRSSRGEPQPREAKVTKIGRKWLTVSHGVYVDFFDFDGLEKERNWGYQARLWPDMASFEADEKRRALWGELRTIVRAYPHPPAHVTSDQIAAQLAVLKEPDAP